MKLFAIGDLHMPGGQDKPMDVFGAHWENHVGHIFEDWRGRVSAEDVVLIPGDLSWAMQLADAAVDLRQIGELPGRKVICKGNHDYWWGSLTQLKAVLPAGMDAIQNSALDVGCAVICGSRGWTLPTEDEPLSAEDQRIFNRELLRMEMSLKEAKRLAAGDKPIVVMIHYPPLYVQLRDTPVTQLFSAYGVHTVVYGHLHGQSVYAGFNGEHGGVRYRLVSSDSLRFSLAEIGLDE